VGVNVDHASNSGLQNIFDDFFLLHEKLMSKLSEIGDVFSLVAKAGKDQDQGIKSSNISMMTDQDKETKQQQPAER